MRPTWHVAAIKTSQVLTDTLALADDCLMRLVSIASQPLKSARSYRQASVLTIDGRVSCLLAEWWSPD